jgi:hypothetical protein
LEYPPYWANVLIGGNTLLHGVFHVSRIPRGDHNGDETSSSHCSLTPEMLGAFLDDTLSADMRERTEAHLAECELCRWVVGSAAKLSRTRPD